MAAETVIRIEIENPHLGDVTVERRGISYSPDARDDIAKLLHEAVMQVSDAFGLNKLLKPPSEPRNIPDQSHPLPVKELPS
jgi:hypothetical protein